MTTLTTVACGGRQLSTPAPSEPDATLRAFMDAVKAQNLSTMANLWGSDRGPAVNWMDHDELTKRLTVIETYLVHDRYEVLGDNTGLSTGKTRTIRVRLFRNGCTPVVPFTLLRYRNGWLVSNIDLGAAGNPQRRCT